MVKQFASENLPPHVQDIADTMNVEMEKIPPFKVPSLPFDNTLSPALFLNKKRQELRKGFEEKIFGYIPPRCDELIFKVTSEEAAFENLAIRREIDIICRHNGMERILHLLLYIPANAKGRVPVFFGLNFKGNHACTKDPGVTFHPFDRYFDS